ncbi:hypothetical protein ZHAS_00016209 [Anopheles sinensis]|uniref:Uncharacterized protein n=1 Tax=Anopheles sinensis TaxID=74873 RepID=A0A084WD51_ANOSI|nr:hypothetical protein ZHAS_00016209 [Anopheles sinensis]
MEMRDGDEGECFCILKGRPMGDVLPIDRSETSGEKSTHHKRTPTCGCWTAGEKCASDQPNRAAATRCRPTVTVARWMAKVVVVERIGRTEKENEKPRHSHGQCLQG